MNTDDTLDNSLMYFQELINPQQDEHNFTREQDILA